MYILKKHLKDMLANSTKQFSAFAPSVYAAVSPLRIHRLGPGLQFGLEVMEL